MPFNWCLVVLLGDKVKVALIKAPPTNGLAVDGAIYTPESGEWTGFYDWLRSDSNEIIGVRYWPFPECSNILDSISKLPYVGEQDQMSAEIFFTPDRRYDPSSSGDQDSAFSIILYSEVNGYALAFGVQWLTQAQIDRLLSVAATFTSG